MSGEAVTIKGTDVPKLLGDLKAIRDMADRMSPRERSIVRSLVASILGTTELVRLCDDCGSQPTMESVIGLKTGSQPRLRIVCSCGRSGSFATTPSNARHRWNTQ